MSVHTSQVRKDSVSQAETARKSPVERGRAAQCGCTGAMSLQGSGTHGYESLPQGLLQLVGYRDPDSRAKSSIQLGRKVLNDSAS
jgi:hypothetical protein